MKYNVTEILHTHCKIPKRKSTECTQLDLFLRNRNYSILFYSILKFLLSPLKCQREVQEFCGISERNGWSLKNLEKVKGQEWGARANPGKVKQ